MRVYFTTTVARADAIFRDGFTDIHEFGGCRGVWVADRKLDCNDGFEGDLTICLGVPDADFARHECVEDGGGPRYRMALIPAADLNLLGKPQVYDHAFAGCSRRDLVRAIRERDGRPGYSGAGDIRNAIEFFDRIGWLTPLSLREPAE